VRIFASEKGIELRRRQIDLRNGEQFGEEYQIISDGECTVPLLQLPDGTKLHDIVGICRYLEEIHPEPPLFGVGATERALVDGWQRWSDREGFYAVMDAFRNSTPGLVGRALPGPMDFVQIPGLAERSQARIAFFFRRLDMRLSSTAFVGGSAFSIADITALVATDFAAWMKLRPSTDFIRRVHR
jgi:glutathione S-transferase